jgi:hypothetical protein
MKIFMLKLSFAIEIGAYLAYTGHFSVSKDPEVKRIAREELRHMVYLKWMLNYYKSKPSLILNAGFLIVGTTIKYLCYITPKPMLNYVACIMEKINVYNYNNMANIFPHFYPTFWKMEESEREHERYFKTSL